MFAIMQYLTDDLTAPLLVLDEMQYRTPITLDLWQGLSFVSRVDEYGFITPEYKLLSNISKLIECKNDKCRVQTFWADHHHIMPRL